MLNAPAIYYQGKDGAEGFEYELVKEFSEFIGKDFVIVACNHQSELYTHLKKGTADFAASLIVPQLSEQSSLLSSPYLETNPVVVYRNESRRPRSLDNINGTNTKLSESALYALNEEVIATAFKDSNPSTDESIGIMAEIQDNNLKHGIINSIDLKTHQAFYPRVKRAFDIAEQRSIRWLFPLDSPPELLGHANRYLAKWKENGRLDHLKDKYFGHLAQFDYVGARNFIRDIKNKLPKYIGEFKKAGVDTGTDWALLAAISYQESHWNPKAVSPTGVRGMMMLTQVTAKEMKVKNRLDPKQSIAGGARYFQKIKKRIPERIDDPDRTWFALAAYNVGYGHLEDARVLTDRADRNPDNWLEVKEFLPLLEKKTYYRTVKHGFARGREPVKYVDNIRRYVEVLRWYNHAATTKSNKKEASSSASRPSN